MVSERLYKLQQYTSVGMIASQTIIKPEKYLDNTSLVFEIGEDGPDQRSGDGDDRDEDGENGEEDVTEDKDKNE